MILILSLCFQLILFSSDFPYTIDDDTKLEFYWSPAQGDVSYYNVYLAIYKQFGEEKSYAFIDKIAGFPTPTEKNPYTLPIIAENGKKYELKVQAESPEGIKSLMSEPSIPVWCKLRSPGDVEGIMPGDSDGNLRVDIDDLLLCLKAFGTKRDEKSFDYRADLNYDDSIDILDLVIVSKNLEQYKLP